MSESSQTNLLIPKLVSWGGTANIVGGVFVAMAYVLHPPEAPPETVASILWLVVHAGFMISLLAGIFALVAFLGQYLKAGGGLSGVVGCVMAITSLVFIFGLDYSEVFIFPTLAVEFPEVVWKYGDGTIMPSVAFAFPLSGAFFLIGYILFTYHLIKTDCVSKNSGILLVLGTLVFGIGLSGFVPMLVVRIGAVLFGAGLVWTGANLKASAIRDMS